MTLTLNSVLLLLWDNSQILQSDVWSSVFFGLVTSWACQICHSNHHSLQLDSRYCNYPQILSLPTLICLWTFKYWLPLLTFSSYTHHFIPFLFLDNLNVAFRYWNFPDNKMRSKLPLPYTLVALCVSPFLYL